MFRKHMRKDSQSNLTPTQFITLGFFILVLLGASVLYMPISYNGEPPSIIDCIFTSTSAVCVTGLVVVDTATTWSAFGQAWLLLLIQIGGIGFMTILTIMLMTLKKRVTYSDKLKIKESLNQDTVSSILTLVKRIVKITLIIEIIGAILLTFYFVPHLGINKGLWYSIFHSISAFCNAGFDLMGNISGEFSSLTSFRSNTYVNVVISILIILGGIGFPVIKDVVVSKKFENLTLHSKIVVISTVCLIFGGAILILLLESGNPYTLSNLTLMEKFNASFFQSITTRTAGMNTIDLSLMRTPTLLIMLLLMFIGASPVSTGGGIKTTVFSVIIIYIKNSLIGNTDNNSFKRRIPKEIVIKSITTMILASSLVFITTLSLTILEPNITLISAIFESISSLATVGLSLGVTPTLCTFSKIILIFNMFLGRVGAMTVMYAISSKLIKNKPSIRYTEENILI